MNGTHSGSKLYRYWIRLAFSLMACVVTFIANGQQENPFELKRRIPAKPVIVDTTHGDSLELSRDTFTVSNDSIVLDSLTRQSSSLDIFNIPPDSLVPDSLIPQIDTVPLDSVPFSADTISTAQDHNKSLPEDKKEKQGFSEGDGLVKRLEDFPISDQIEVENRNVLLGVSILTLLLLASLLAVNRSLIRKSYRAIANDNYLRFLNREYKSMPWLYWLFYLHFFINAGFFTYLLLHYFRWYQGGSIVVLLFCILFVFGAYMLKHLTLNTLASTFPVEKETGLYGFVTLLVNILLGIALLPLNLLVAFGPASVVPFAIWAGIGLIILLYLFRQLKGLFISGRLVRSYVFHFFLYLCSAEIAPLLIVGKLALGNFG